MALKSLRALALPVALSLLASGCFVATARFEEKVAEADTLRDALAAANREKGALAGRFESLQKQFADLKETADSCAVRSKGQEAELSRLNGELATAKRSYEGTRITREELITELMEKEKATGKRIQELTARSQASQAEADKLKKEIERTAREIAARDAQIAEIQAKLEKAQGDEALRRERDTLLGRIERMTEDRKAEEKRREGWFDNVSAKLKESASAATVTSAGGVLRVSIADKALLKSGGAELTDTGKAVAAETSATLVEFPAARVIVNALPDGKAMKALVAAIVDGEKVTGDRVVGGGREKESGAELLVIVP
jgi:predicted RNase H-like nuclease (RuvC/YqgF family)